MLNKLILSTAIAASAFIALPSAAQAQGYGDYGRGGYGYDSRYGGYGNESRYGNRYDRGYDARGYQTRGYDARGYDARSYG
ncbi:MAG: glycine zipper 2TM domain-containing protein, partial [Allosphingosinicella sp.]